MSSFTEEQSSSPNAQAAEQLERGEILYYPQCPFSALTQKQQQSLLDEALTKACRHENLSYEPAQDRWQGDASLTRFLRKQTESIFTDFLQAATNWMQTVLPQYVGGWRNELVTFYLHEEATRHFHPGQRNDLIHLDAREDRPTEGWRSLRLLINASVDQDRVWATSDTFAELLSRFDARAILASSSGNWAKRLLLGLPAIWGASSRASYDEWMLRFDHFLKNSDAVQDRGRRKIWKFPPGSAWLVMTDAASHAVLRGQYALELSVLISPDVLALPEESPRALWEHSLSSSRTSRAA